MAPVQEHLIQLAPAGRYTKLVMPLADLHVRLTPDGEVAVLGLVHYVLRRLASDGDIHSHDADYLFDGDRLELSLPRQRAPEIVIALTQVIQRPGLLDRRPA
jgi:hypothetical protein